MVKCQFVYNWDILVLISMLFDEASSWGSVMVLDKDTFLSAAFRKVQKIRKALKSNGTNNKAGFL